MIFKFKYSSNQPQLILNKLDLLILIGIQNSEQNELNLT